MHRTKIIKKHFTLVEILVALALFMMAIAPLLGLLMKTTKVHTDNIKRIKAQMLAKDELARFTLFKTTNNPAFNDGADASGPMSLRIPSTYVAPLATGNTIKHPKYNGLYYRVDYQNPNPGYNLALFTLTIGYTKGTWDEVYKIYIAKDE